MRTRTQANGTAHKSGPLAVLTSNDDSAIEAALSSIPEVAHSPIDGLRFKLLARNGRHFFTDVRFSSEFIQTSDMLAVITLLDGTCLEELNADFVAAVLSGSPCVNEVQKLIGELQTVLCN